LVKERVIAKFLRCIVSESIPSFKVDFEDNPSDKLTDAGKVVCMEKNGGQTICGKTLEVVWPNTNALQYRAPTEYTLNSSSRTANN
jgi:hypothetical protein